MDLQQLIPMLRTPDVEGSVAFYTGVLGFECLARSEDGTWASVGRGPVTLMLSGLNQHEGDQRPVFTGSLYFRTGDVNALWERLKGKARISYPIESFDYGMREFGLHDNNGYLLQFGQELPES